jgi:RNA polymerase sigma factor (sigma-70 family)
MQDEGTGMATGLRQVLEHLGQAGAGLTDGQLLARFVAARDEAAFAALVRRHGPMVLSVCRRVLRHEQDAEDAFQAAFLVLARKAGSVVKRESLSCWLYQVAYHTALEARAAGARRRARETPMPDAPHPEVAPAEADDWRPLLDRELGRLPEKYRAAVVLCDLEGQSRREAARVLGVPEGTVSSRLATAHKRLARQLARYGLAPAGGVAAALSAGRASAQVPAALVWSTARAAALVAAGHLAAAPGPAVVLMRGVFQTMFLTKLKLTAAVAVVVAALVAGGLVYQAGGVVGPAQAAPEGGKPATELEALRRENELLKLNLLVVLEKVRAQDEELRGLRGRQAETGPGVPGPGSGGRMSGSTGGMGPVPGSGPMGPGGPGPGMPMRGMGPGPGMLPVGGPGVGPMAGPPLGPGEGGVGPAGMMGPMGGVRRGAAPKDPVQEAESAVRALREARDEPTKQRATDALERALRRLKGGQEPDVTRPE